jgi:hypothetical protein
VDSVTLTTRKPPKGLAGAPYVVERGIDLDGLAEETVIFEGTAREACKGFPTNVTAGSQGLNASTDYADYADSVGVPWLRGMQMQKDPRTFTIIGAAMEVHRVLGTGFLEAVHQGAFGRELTKQGIPFRAEVELPVCYKGERLSTSPDLDLCQICVICVICG